MNNKNDCNERNNAKKQIRDAIFFNGDSIDFTKVSIEDTVNNIEDLIYKKNDIGNDSKKYRNIIRDTIMKIKKSENINFKKELFYEKINIEEYLDKINQANYKTLNNNNNIGNKRRLINPPKVKLHNKNNSFSNTLNNNNNLKKSFDRYDEEINDNILKHEIVEKLNESIKKINDNKEHENKSKNCIQKEEKYSNNNGDNNYDISNVNKDDISNLKNDNNYLISNVNNEDITTINNISIITKEEIPPNSNNNISSKDCKKDIPNKNKKELKRNYSLNSIKNNKDLLEMQIKQKELETQCKFYKKEILELKEIIKKLQNEKIDLSSNNKKLQIENTILKEKLERINKENINLKKINNENNKNYSQFKEKIELKTTNLEIKLTNFLENIKTSNFETVEKKNEIKPQINTKEEISDNLKIEEERKKQEKQNIIKKLYDEKNPFIDASSSFSSFINSEKKE